MTSRRWPAVVATPDGLGRLTRYGLAALNVAAAAGASLWLEDILQGQTDSLFVAAVLVTATLAGRGPALAAVLLSTVALHALLMGPRSGWGVGLADLVPLLVFTQVALLTSWLSTRWRESALQARKLAESRRLYETAVQHLENGLAVATVPDGRTRVWNPRMTDLTGVSAEAALGQHLLALNEPLYRRTADPQRARTTERQAFDAACSGTSASLELQVASEEAGAQDLQVLFFPIADPASGTVVACGKVTQDITGERQAARTREDLLNTVSHELRTPLSSLVGFTELLRTRTFSQQEQQELLAIIDREGKRLTRLIDDFLNLQRLERGAERIVARPIDLGELLRSAAALFGRDPTHPLVLDIPPTLPRVQADPDRVQQVLANLLSNAVKYSPEGGPVRVSAQAQDGMVEVAVTDQGLGLTAEALGRVFQGFYRADEAQQRQIPGTGLGLSITRRLVEVQGGTLRAASSGPGQGSTFCFTLPVAPQSRQADVLVVEDDPGFAALLQARLDQAGLTTVLAPNAETAVDLLPVVQPRGLVLDLVLPGQSGEGLLRALTRDGSLPAAVVVVTAQDLLPAQEQALGAQGVVAVYRKGPHTAGAAARSLGRALT